METKQVIHEDGELFFIEHYLNAEQRGWFYRHFEEQIDWREEQIMLFGKAVTVPRRVAWYGEPDAVYHYSGVTHTPQIWLPALYALKTDLEQRFSAKFNSVLANFYRHGQDSMGWHADNEPELGAQPLIASLSLGGQRLFKLQHKRTKRVVDLPLNAGSLVIMKGELQNCWRHCVPKTKKPVTGRINLTYRYVYKSPER